MIHGVFTMLGPEGYGNYRLGDGPAQRVHDYAEHLLTPGFVDIHIHGAFGIDTMSASPEEFETLCRYLEREGYEGFLPTTITASTQDVTRALANLPEHPMILGFHLEGPFISPDYPGAQPPSAILAPPVGPSEWDAILDDPRLKVITLAPELPGALDLILRLSKRGVRVSLGHTNASFDEARRAFEFGAAHTTHTFNAMRPLHHREAGMVGYALSNPDLKAELIYDRLHVCREAAQLLLQTKPADHVVAVSDCTAANGLPPGTPLKMWGHDVEVGRGEVRLKANGALAGSAITLRDAFQNLAEDFGPETAIRACCHNPRTALGLNVEPKVYLEWSREYKMVAIHRV